MPFFGGVDPSQGGSKRTSNKRTDSDDFAIATIQGELNGPAKLVDMDRATGITADQMSAMLHKKNLMFNYEYIVMDPNGGGLPVRDKAREPLQDTGAEQFTVRPLITRDDDQMAGVGDPKLIFFGRGDSRIVGDRRDPSCPGCGLDLKGESVLPNTMHQLFRAALESNPKRIMFPPEWPGWGNNIFNNADEMRHHLNSIPGLSPANKAHSEIDLALAQLVQIDKRMNPDMRTPYTDTLGNFEFCSSQKKDSAYAMIYAYFALWLWRAEQTIFARRAKPQVDRVFMFDEV